MRNLDDNAGHAQVFDWAEGYVHRPGMLHIYIIWYGYLRWIFFIDNASSVIWPVYDAKCHHQVRRGIPEFTPLHFVFMVRHRWNYYLALMLKYCAWYIHESLESYSITAAFFRPALGQFHTSHTTPCCTMSVIPVMTTIWHDYMPTPFRNDCASALARLEIRIFAADIESSKNIAS
jgi:hypothetical protein